MAFTEQSRDEPQASLIKTLLVSAEWFCLHSFIDGPCLEGTKPIQTLYFSSNWFSATGLLAGLTSPPTHTHTPPPPPVLVFTSIPACLSASGCRKVRFPKKPAEMCSSVPPWNIYKLCQFHLPFSLILSTFYKECNGGQQGEGNQRGCLSPATCPNRHLPLSNMLI